MALQRLVAALHSLPMFSKLLSRDDGGSRIELVSCRSYLSTEIVLELLLFSVYVIACSNSRADQSCLLLPELSLTWLR